MQQLLDQSALRVVPAARPGDAWTAPEHAHTAADLRAVLDSGVSAGAPAAPSASSAEIAYNRARPTRIAWLVLTLSLLLSIAAMDHGPARPRPRRGRSRSSPASR